MLCWYSYKRLKYHIAIFYLILLYLPPTIRSKMNDCCLLCLDRFGAGISVSPKCNTSGCKLKYHVSCYIKMRLNGRTCIICNNKETDVSSHMFYDSEYLCDSIDDYIDMVRTRAICMSYIL